VRASGRSAAGRPGPAPAKGGTRSATSAGGRRTATNAGGGSIRPDPGAALVVEAFADATGDAAWVSADEVMQLQRLAGNDAVSGFIAQRIGPDPMPSQDPNLKKALEADKLPEDYAKKSDAEKIAAIRSMIGRKSPAVIARAWSQLGDELGQARANPDLFAQCVKIDDDILDHDAFETLKTRFQKDVEQTALNYTSENRDLVLGEMRKVGSDEEKGKEPGAEADFAVQDIQKAAGEMERVRDAKKRILGTNIGWKKGVVGQRGWQRVGEETFQPSGPPTFYEPLPGADAANWDKVNAEWKRTLAIEAALIREYPSAAYFMNVEGGKGAAEGLEKIKTTTDIKVARAEISKALQDLVGKIEKVVPLIGDDLDYLDFPPIQQQLLGGQVAPSGTNWSKPVEKAIAREEIADATIADLLTTIGVSTVGAAFFVFASIATAGGAAALGAVLFAGGAVVGGGQAIASWDKYLDLATAHASTVDPELALVTGEQVESAQISAILDTIFAAMDVWQGIKGAYLGLKGGKAVLEAGKAGAEASTRAALRNLGKAGNPKELLTRAFTEFGHEKVSKMTGLSYDELAEMIGKESELGQRLLKLGKIGVDPKTADLVAKLPKLAELGLEEGEQVLRASLETNGMIGTLRKAGGWAAIKNSAAFKGGSGSAKAMEAWRAGVVKELSDYIARESDAMSKAVRTGTEKAASDVDVQIVGGAAAELQTKAEGWLAGRLGTNIKGAKNLLDAEIFVDPFRAHLIDIMKDIAPAVRERISAKMGEWERRMVYGAKYKTALKESQQAADKVLKEAESLNIKPFMEFEPLSANEQKRVAGLIDGWMGKLRSGEGDPDELIEMISKAQASIGASHADMYVGGGVRVWVTGRDEDVAKLAAAIGMDPEVLKSAASAQRVIAALTEAKWFEAAAKRLHAPSATDDLAKLAKDVSNIGKHGGRAAQQLGKAGAPNGSQLDALFEQLWKFKEMPADELTARITGGELGQIRNEIDGLLGTLKTQTRSAVDGLASEIKAMNLPADEMAEFQKWLKWQAAYATLVDASRQATGAYIDALHAALQAKAGMSIPEPEPNQSVAPAPTAAPAGTGP
jgi:hypothetical protein